VARLFWIFDVPPGGVRGPHAHKLCHQYMVCAVGSCTCKPLMGAPST
jgi:hypothetical protein